MDIWTPKMMAAVESEATKFSMLWPSAPCPRPSRLVGVGDAEAVLDMVSPRGVEGDAVNRDACV